MNTDILSFILLLEETDFYYDGGKEYGKHYKGKARLPVLIVRTPVSPLVVIVFHIISLL